MPPAPRQHDERGYHIAGQQHQREDARVSDHPGAVLEGHGPRLEQHDPLYDLGDAA